MNHKVQHSHFSIDVSVPFIFYGKSHSVDELVRHQVSKYLNFMSVKELNVIRASGSWTIPTDRGRIFADKHLKLTEKRALMTIFKTAAQTQSALVHSTTLVGSDSKNPVVSSAVQLDPSLSAVAYLHSINIVRPDIVLGIIHCVCMYPLPADTMKAVDMMDRIGKFIGSLDAYETGCPFLVPTYGNGDIPQSFARIAAVHGATQILGCSYESIKTELRDKNYVLINDESRHTLRIVHGVIGTCLADLDPQTISLNLIIDEEPNFLQHPVYCLTIPHSASGETRPGVCPPSTCLRHIFSIVSDEQSDVERMELVLSKYRNDKLLFERVFIENSFGREPGNFFDIDSFMHTATEKLNHLLGRARSDPLPVPPPPSNPFEDSTD